MPCNRDADNCEIKKMLEDAVADQGDHITLKLVASSTPGDPALGIGATYTFTMRPSRAVIEQVNQTDIMNSGGIYLTGDIKVQMREKLREVIDFVGSIGDRILWDGYEYRIVGKRWPETLDGVPVLYQYTFRKVDDIG